MAATLYGDSDLVFGVPVVTGIYLQTSTARRMGKVSEAVDEQNTVVGIAISHGNVGEIDGTYLFRGADIATAIGDAITGLDDLGFTDVYVHEFGQKRVKDNFAEGDFKAIGVDFPA